MINAKKYLVLTCMTLAISAFAIPAIAQDSVTMPESKGLDIPVTSAKSESTPILTDQVTHPPLRLTPDKSEIINLNTAAGSIIIGNPAHFNILADSGTRLIIAPRAPGASFFTVLDKDGKIIMQRHVIVGSATENYIRVRRNCMDGADCGTTSVYYCPDMCHEIQESTSTGSSGQAEIQNSGNTGPAPASANQEPPSPSTNE